MNEITTTEKKEIATDNSVVAFDMMVNGLVEWSESVAETADRRVSNSWPWQIFNFLRFDCRRLTGMPVGTFDFRLLDEPEQYLGRNNADVWHAIAYWMKRAEGLAAYDAGREAEMHFKSVRSGCYNLQQVAMASEHANLFIVSHNPGSRGIEVITFNGSYSLEGGKLASDVSGERAKRRWESSTIRMLEKRGVDISNPNVLADVKVRMRLVADVESLTHDAAPAIEHIEQQD